MKQEEFTDEHQATTATCLRLTQNWKHTGRVVIADSWFGSVTSAVQLMKVNGLHSIMLVKTAHSIYPKETFSNIMLKRGEWVTRVAEIDNINLMAVKFVDLQPKQFISTCSVSTSGPPRKTKHHGSILRPQVAFEYLSYCAGIDIHNHIRTGSTGFEDTWLTKKPHNRQFAGILGFVFTNAYQAMQYFGRGNMLHTNFKMDLANAMVSFVDFDGIRVQRSLLNISEPSDNTTQHILSKYLNKGIKMQKPCFYCRHGYDKSFRRKTSFYCSACGIEKAICSPETRDCWDLHLKNGMPKKRRCMNN